MISNKFLLIIFNFTVLFAEKLHFPTIHITIPASNKAKWLPYTLSLLEKQDYPKSRIAVEFFTDHNLDNTAEIIKKWASKPETRASYANINVVHNSTILRDLPLTWSMNMLHGIKYRAIT